MDGLEWKWTVGWAITVNFPCRALECASLPYLL